MVTEMGFNKVLSFRPTKNFEFFDLCTGNFEEKVPFSVIKCKNWTLDDEK